MEKKLNCLRCGADMHFLKQEYIQLGKTGWILGDWPNLISGALRVDIFHCPECGKLEFFSTEAEAEDESLPQRKCPRCGRLHDVDFPKCPFCKFDYYAN